MASSASFAVGLFGLSLAVAAPSGNDPLPSEVRVIYGAVAAIGILCGFISVVARAAVGQRQHSQIQDVLDYMHELEEDFPSV